MISIVDPMPPIAMALARLQDPQPAEYARVWRDYMRQAGNNPFMDTPLTTAYHQTIGRLCLGAFSKD